MDVVSSGNFSGQIVTFTQEEQQEIDNYKTLTQKEIEALPKEELVENYKNAQWTIITEKAKNRQMALELEKNKKEAAIAIAKATQRQAVANLQENQQNRADFSLMERNTTLGVVGRVVSLIISIAAFVITLVCIFV